MFDFGNSHGFVRETSHRYPCAVVSIPKAGTYFVAEMLKHLGWAGTEIHASPLSFTDYRNLSLAQKRADPRSREIGFPLDFVVQALQPGQFFVGHIPFSSYNERILSRTRLIFIRRELRSALVSYMRFLHKNNREMFDFETWRDLCDPRQRVVRFLAERGAFMVRWITRIADWHSAPSRSELSFETLYGDHGDDALRQMLGALSSHLGIQHREAAFEAAKQVQGVDTKTWSGSRTDLSTFWSGEAEQLFSDAGGRSVNQAMGYD